METGNLLYLDKRIGKKKEPLETLMVFKPSILREKKLASALMVIEDAGIEIFDILSFEMTSNDVYDLLGIERRFPKEPEVDSFEGGMCVGVFLKHPTLFTAMKKLRMTECFDCYVATMNVAEALAFWFGVHAKREEPTSCQERGRPHKGGGYEN